MHEITSEALPNADFEAIRRIENSGEIIKNYTPYIADESKLSHQGVEYLFFPATEAELSAIFREMAARDITVTISAARTGIVGGAVPYGGAIVSLEKFDKLLGLKYDTSAKEWRVRAECAVTVRDLNNWAMKKNFPLLREEVSAEIKQFFQDYKEDPAIYFYPPDPTELGAAIGGTVSTNASGARTYRYGPTRNWVRWIRIMLASGEILDIPRGKYFATPAGEFTVIDSTGSETQIKVPTYSMPRTKNAAGIFAAPHMDLIDLFIGSEGIFGAITQVEVALQRWTKPISIVLFLPSDDMAVKFVQLLRSEKGFHPEFIEFYSSFALDFFRIKQKEDPKTVGMPTIPDYANAAVFFDIGFDPEATNNDYSKLEDLAFQCGSTLAQSWAGYEQRDLERFKEFRHLLPETVNAIIAERKKRVPELYKLGTDFAVPDDALGEIWAFYKFKLERAGLEWVAYGHIGNNHLHINVMPRSVEEMQLGLSVFRDFAEKVVSLNGTISAEHGVGKIKKEFLSIMFPNKELEEMKTIKHALDPGLMINPGDMLDI